MEPQSSIQRLTGKEFTTWIGLALQQLNQRHKPFVPMHVLNLEPAPPQDLSELSFSPLQRTGHVHHVCRNRVLEPVVVLCGEAILISVLFRSFTT